MLRKHGVEGSNPSTLISCELQPQVHSDFCVVSSNGGTSGSKPEGGRFDPCTARSKKRKSPRPRRGSLHELQMVPVADSVKALRCERSHWVRFPPSTLASKNVLTQHVLTRTQLFLELRRGFRLPCALRRAAHAAGTQPKVASFRASIVCSIETVVPMHPDKKHPSSPTQPLSASAADSSPDETARRRFWHRSVTDPSASKNDSSAKKPPVDPNDVRR